MSNLLQEDSDGRLLNLGCHAQTEGKKSVSKSGRAIGTGLKLHFPSGVEESLVVLPSFHCILLNTFFN